MDIQTFQNVASKLPAEMAILMRAPTGVGKSFLAKYIADELTLPFLDVRLSTMSEGDVGGYPDLDGMKDTGVMTFCMPSWFIRACQEPVVLCLDELNRALIGVQQSAFQLILDRQLGNDKNGVPYTLHPDTRIVACVNTGAEYTVEDMDPALLRRFWVVDLAPTSDDFVKWATDKLNPATVDFIRNHPEHLRVDPGEVDPGTICPNPASWHRLDTSLQHMGILKQEAANSGSFYSVASGFVGTEAAIAFTEFVKNYSEVITAEDILDNWKSTETKVSDLTNSKVNGLIEKLANHCKDNSWTIGQSKNVAAFAKALPGEMMVNLWNKISASQNLPNIQKLHKLIGQEVVRAVQGGRNVK
jgi:hypothetical protein